MSAKANCDAAIIGAGPYGLAAAAHLRKIKGLDVKIFGEPMGFWRSHMPVGMFLRSPWQASHIADPDDVLTMDSFQRSAGNSIPVPIPLKQFVEYGLWFRSQAVPDVDSRQVAEIRKDRDSLELTLDDGSTFRCSRAIVASGIRAFARRPAPLDQLPSELVTHTCDRQHLENFSNKRVVVIGAGQSALEQAALLHESGAEVEVIVRSPKVRWLSWKARLQTLGPVGKVLYSRHDIGPPGISRIVAFPRLVQVFPRKLQDDFRTRALRPAGARWLIERCEKIPITTGRFVTNASEKGGRVVLELDNGNHREVDHVVLGTGYRVDVARYPFIGAELGQCINQVQGFPKVNAGFESSVKGLHFIGAPSAWTFGPLMYFVCGTRFAARTLSTYISKKP
jgi:FAD-dependent urate hydroxylase